MSNKALTVTDFDTMQRMSLALYKSGYFDDVRSEAQAIVKVMAGAELGLPPFAAMTGVHIIKGKPVIGANVIATLIKNDPRYDYRIKTHTAELCEIEFSENGTVTGMSSFSIQEAKAAGVGGARPPGKPATMLEMFPRNMLFSRAISNGARWYAPGIFGGAPVYTPDEMGADVDADGYVDGSYTVHVDEEGEVVYDGLPEPDKAPAKPAHKPPQATNGRQPTMTPDERVEALTNAVKSSTADGFWLALVNNIERYAGNEHAAKNAVRLFTDKLPGNPDDRVTLALTINAYAQRRDAGMSKDDALKGLKETSE